MKYPAMCSKLCMTAILTAILFVLGCTGSIEVVGHGERVDVQHGLKVELAGTGDGGALVRILNTSAEIVSVNQSPLAFKIFVRTNGTLAKPSGQVMIDWVLGPPKPDDFVIIGPGQTRTIPVPFLWWEENRFYALDKSYTIEKGTLYEVEVQLHPYFGGFTKASAGKILSDLKIPNYLDKPLMMNTMTIRAR